MVQVPIAVATLGRLGKTSELVALANDAQLDERVRQQVAEELAASGANEEAIAAFSALAGDSDVAEAVRQQAAEALGTLGGLEQAIVVLKNLANGAFQEMTRYEAVRALLELGQTDVGVAALMQIARDKSVDEWTRSSLVRLLGANGLTDRLVLLANDESEEFVIRFAAARECLEYEIVEPFHSLALRAWDNDEVLGFLTADSELVEWRIILAGILGALGEMDKARSGLVQIAFDHEQADETRFQAAETLGQLDLVDDAVSALTQLVQKQGNEADALRLKAAKKIAELGRLEEAAQAFETLARSSQVAFVERVEAAESLGRIVQPGEARSILKELADTDECYARRLERVAESLANLGFGSEVFQLVATRDLSASSQFQLAESLQTTGQTGSAEHLFRALAQNTSVYCPYRRDAAIKLSQLGQGDEAVAILVAIAHKLDDSDDMKNGVAGLKTLNREDELRTLMQDNTVDAGNRVAAAVALGELGHAAEVTRYLMDIARDHTHPLTKALKFAVEELSRFAWFDDLDLLVSNEELDVDVRLAAAKELGKLGRTEPLLKFAYDESLGWKRRMVVHTLQELELGSALLTLVRDKDMDIDIRRRAAESLARYGVAGSLVKSGDARALSDLEQIAQSDSDEPLRLAAQAAVESYREYLADCQRWSVQ